MKRFSILLPFLFFFCPGIHGQAIPDYRPYKPMTPSELSTYRQSIWDTLPAAIGWVNDFEGLYSFAEERNLESILEHFEKKTSIEICIVTLDSNMVENQKFDEFAYRLMKKWGIGKISKSNGIVICISKDYQRLCVNTDFGIDRYMNEKSKFKIIQKEFIPSFQKNNYYQGTLTGLNAILAKIMKGWKKEDQ